MADLSTNADDLKTPPQFKAARRQAMEAESRYRQTQASSELDAALEAWSSILHHHTFPTVAQRFRLAAMNDAGNLFMRRYWATHQGADLDQALDLWQHVIAEMPPDSPELPTYYNNLGVGLQNRYVRTRQEQDLIAAISFFQQALDRTATATPAFYSYSDNLGTALLSLYRQTQQVADLNAVIQHFGRLVDTTPEGSPHLPSFLTRLSNTLTTRYTHLGDLTDLNTAIQSYQQVVDLTPDESPEMPERLNRLGVSLNARYESKAALSDIETAIPLFQRAVELAPATSTALPTYLTNLGTGLMSRYHRTGRLADLEVAITFFQQAVDQTPADSPYFSRHLANLGNGFASLHKRTRQRTDLEAAMRVFQQAVSHAPPDSNELPGYLTNLGNSLLEYYELTQQLADLSAAITAYQQAVDKTPLTSRKLPKYLTNLGIGLRSRYTTTNQPDDLAAAVRVAQQAVDLAPGDWPELPAYLANLGNVLQDRYTLAKEPADLVAATTHYRQSCQRALELAPEVVLQTARTWGHWAAQRQDWPEAAEAYAYGQTAIDRLFALQSRRADQISLLGLSYGVAANTAYAHARAGNLRSAVKAMEQGRARMLTQTLAHSQRIHEDFSASPTFADIQSALCKPQTPSQTPRIGIYLLTTVFGGLALVVHRTGVEAVWLTALTNDEFWSLVHNWTTAYEQHKNARGNNPSPQWHEQMAATLHRLWELVMQPITHALAALGLAANAGHAQPLLTLIPTSLLSLWPLHATWRPDDQAATGRRYLLDDYAIRYAPSATVLHYCEQRAINATTQQFLAVAEPRPVQATALPNAHQEVKAINNLFAGGTTLLHNQATHANVHSQLTQAAVVHFACHGVSNWQDSMASGLLLANDEWLTVSDLLALTLPNARLATLSACETGIVATLPDEVIMLPSALVQAGYAGVVASLWSVADVSTALLMTRFYECWQKDGLEPVHALRAAQRWLRDATAAELQLAQIYAEQHQASGRRDRDAYNAQRYYEAHPEEQPFHHPFWWGAFYLTGA